MLDDFFVRAVLAGIGAALAAAPLGCFVVWRRMAYFGTATSHAAILGVALSLALSTPIFLGVLLIGILIAIIVATLDERILAIDTVLGVLSHGALAAGLVAVSFLHDVRIDVMSYLFGDILAVNKSDLSIIWGGAIAVIAVIAWRWQRLLISTLNPDLATASGITPRVEQLILTLLLAIVVAVAIKVVGALLIGAMLIIPAAAARPLSQTPEQMAGFAALIGVVAAISGLQASASYDTPAGPSIICAVAVLFLIGQIIRPLRNK